MIFAILAASACTGAPPPGAPAGRTRPALGEQALAAVGARPEVVALDGDVALLCSEAAPATDADDAMPDCDAATVDATGALAELGRGGL
ncbi:MAG TPA: hypothetical protein VHE35_07615, partial [Kofleriaceae bacterium]|nr:hypothetical protein [Kofleriaceae bacterium]